MLRDFEAFRAVQMSNPSWVSVEQLAALSSLPWPVYPGAIDDVVVVGEEGAARGGDSTTRRAIELDAMAAVAADYEQRGGSVKDVSAACVGYDLECTAPMVGSSTSRSRALVGGARRSC